jgi:hypothetical protein
MRLTPPRPRATSRLEIRRLLRGCTGAAIMIGALLHAAAPSAQEATAPALKAAFVANFAKFTEWPADARASGRAFRFCVIGDAAVAGALEQVVSAHAHGGTVPVVARMTADEAFGGCDVLYVSGVRDSQLLAVLDAIRTAPILTVGDGDGFAERGGVAQLIQERGRMRFAINPAAAQRARLALSAKLLNLAILVKEGSDARR